MINWLLKLFNKFWKAFKTFIAEALPILSQIIIGKLKDFAYQTIEELSHSDLTNEEKRKKAFDKIRDKAVEMRIDIADSLVYTIIELAVQKLKNKE